MPARRSPLWLVIGGSATRVVVQLPGLGRGVHGRPAGGVRAGAGAREHERHRGGLPADGPVRAAAGAHGAVGRVPGGDRRRGVSGMTTAEPPYPLVTPVTKATMAGKPAYTVLNTVLCRVDAAPPSNPRPPRRYRGSARTRGAAPRTPGPVRAWLSSAPAWSPPASRGRSAPTGPPRRRLAGDKGVRATDPRPVADAPPRTPDGRRAGARVVTG